MSEVKDIPKDDVVSLPKGWVETTLGGVCSKVTDGSHQSPKAFKGGMPMLSVKDMNEFGFDIDNSKTISVEDYNILCGQGCKPEINDILIAKDGSVLKHIFRVRESIDAVLLSSIAIVRPIIKIVDPGYLAYILSNPNFKKYVINNFLSGSGVPRIVLKDFKKIQLTLPPLPEQKSIAAILTAFDDKIELLQAQNKTLEDTAQTIFKEWFGKYQIGDELPEGWRVGKLGDASSLTAGGDKPKNFSLHLTEKYNIPIYSNGISNDGLYGFTDIPKIVDESVTVSARGTIGFVCLRLESFVPIVRLITLRPKKELLSSKYLYFWLKNQIISGTGTTQQQLTVPDFSRTKIILPRFEIMNDFTIIANSVFRKISINKRQIQTLTKTRDALLPKLMSGEIRVSEL